MKGYFNAKNDAPPEGVIVEVVGEDRHGEWHMPVFRKNYKQKPNNTKRYFKDKGICWRWCYAAGILSGNSVDYEDHSIWWRPIQETQSPKDEA